MRRTVAKRSDHLERLATVLRIRHRIAEALKPARQHIAVQLVIVDD